MPRELGDVLHYLLPDAAPADAAVNHPAQRSRTAPARLEAAREQTPPSLPMLAVPIGDRDVVRAALAWNLGVEIARRGGRSLLVTPDGDDASPLWPVTGDGPLGSRVVVNAAQRLVELHRAALDVAIENAPDARDGGLVIVRVPPAWLRAADRGSALLRWTLLLCGADARDLLEAYGLAKLVRAAQPAARVGVTLHGVRRLRDAERGFARLATCARRHLGCSLRSYGALLGDLDVYRAIVARRAIGLEHPQSAAARALVDVGGLVFADARVVAHG